MNRDFLRVDKDDNSLRLFCARCAAIDFDKIFQTRLTRAKGLWLLKLGKIPDVSDRPSCPVCLFFAQVILRPSNSALSGLETEYSLYAFSTVRALLVGFSPVRSTISGLKGGVCLAVLPEDVSYVPPNQTQFIGVHQSPTYATLRFRQLSPAAVDLQLIQQWYQFCTVHHSLLCSLENADSIPDLRVIHCISRKIVPRLRQRYAALSYVWGDSHGVQDEEISNAQLPLNVPAVIEDAMTLSRKLGIEHIWVDRYCIPRDNLHQKQRQIKHMDLVYKSAEITIVAAAGYDPAYGLPGVGLKSRIPQPAVKVQGKLLLSSLPNPMEEINASKWMERAWTYQEAILSRRRVIFTPRQVYFECRTMHCCEAIDVPLDLIHRKNKQQCKTDILPGLFPGNILGDYPWEILKRINEYSQRELHYESDRLNAILGIFHALHKSQYMPRYHYLGIPLMAWSYLCTSEEGSKLGFLAGLQWMNEQPTERRDGFPSWSWTGWNGLLKEEERYSSQWGNGITDIKVWIECPDSKLLEWPAGECLARMGSADVSRFLRIQAWTLQLRFELFEHLLADRTESGFRVVSSWSARSSSAWRMQLVLRQVAIEEGDFYHRLQRDIFLGIVLSVGWTGTSCDVLVVDSFGEYVERIGIVRMGFPYRIFDAETGEPLPICGDLALPIEKMIHRLG
jgi:hypothetical protein